jgi:hypothetical protein
MLDYGYYIVEWEVIWMTIYLMGKHILVSYFREENLAMWINILKDLMVVIVAIHPKELSRALSEEL